MEKLNKVVDKIPKILIQLAVITYLLDSWLPGGSIIGMGVSPRLVKFLEGLF